MAVNARFDQGHIERGPVFNTLGSTSTLSKNPSFALSYRLAAGTNQFLVCYQDGTIGQWQPGAAPTDCSASGWTPSTYQQPYTACVEDDVVFVNRPDRVPWYMLRGGTAFATLPNWPSGWRCQAFRTFNSQLIALNVTETATNYSTMVAWSDFMTWDSTPGTWTAAPTNSAGSNVLSDLQDALVDGLPLRNTFILYSQQETWAMTATGDTEVFSFQKLFDTNYGVVSQNCVAEVNNQHYVFGLDQIWRHNGYQQEDISSGVVKDFIYTNMDKTNRNQFFVVHAPRNTEVMFCYRSADPYCAFPIGGANNYQGCNRAAVYNYKQSTWYFYDLPYVTGAAFAGSAPSATYASLGTMTYSQIAGSYSSYGDSSKLCLYMVGNAASSSIPAAIRNFEKPGSPFQSGVIDTNATAPSSLYISQINLDEVGANLRGYKVLKSIYPLGRIDVGASGTLMFSFGSSDYPNIPAPQLGNAMSFDGGANYKLDYMAAGRYLSMQVTFSDYRNFKLSGMDVDFEVTGNR